MSAGRARPASSIPVDAAGSRRGRDVTPDFTDARSRSRARCREYDGQQEVREVEALFADMIARAERTIYIENQFLTCDAIAKALAKRLQGEARARSR